MIQKYRLCLTVILVFGIMGWFIQMLEADKNNYHTSLFGGALKANIGFQNRNLQPSIIRFVPKNASKMAFISTQEILEIQEVENLVTSQFHSTNTNRSTTLYLKSDTQAAMAHQILPHIRSFSQQKVKISDFQTFAKEAKEEIYFRAPEGIQDFIDYQSLIDEFDVILWTQ